MAYWSAVSTLDDWLNEPEVPATIKKVWPEAVPTTDQMDKTTPEERNKLLGFCDHCKHWYKFTRGTDKETCPKCGGNHSVKIGFQLISQRSFNPAGKKVYEPEK